MVLDRPRIQARHQLRSRFVVNAPEAYHHASRARVQESASQADQPFASDLFAEPSLTRAQHHEIGRQLQVVDLVRAKKTILRRALLVDQRQHYAGQFRIQAVKKAMSRKMNESILAELIARSGRLARGEVHRLLSITGRRERQYSLGFSSCSRQPWNHKAFTSNSCLECRFLRFN